MPRPPSTPSPRPGPGMRAAPYQSAGYGSWKKSKKKYADAVSSYNGLEVSK